MLSQWQLPTRHTLGDREFRLNTDYRDMLEIFSYLNNQNLPEFLRWQIAVGLFYEEPVPEEWFPQAVGYLCSFLTGGRQEKPGPRLLSWEQDAPIIAAEINKVAGREIRLEPYVHWWTFLSWFHSIGQGQLATMVSVREKLARGKKLEDWEREFYRKNKALVDLPRQYTPQELAEKARLEKLLGE